MGRIAKAVIALFLLGGFVLSSVGCNEKILEKIKEICEQLNPEPEPEPPPEDPPPPDGGDGSGVGI